MRRIQNIIIVCFTAILCTAQINAQNWVEINKTPPPSNDTVYQFGLDADISGNVGIIGSQRDEYVFDLLFLELLNETGEAYIFEKGCCSNWIYKQKLVGSESTTGSTFGSSVSISGNYAVVGAWNEGLIFDSTGPGPGQYVAGGLGQAYIYEKDGAGIWIEKQLIKASDPVQDGFFGRSVDIDGNQLVAGAFGDQTDPLNADTLINAGAVYFFDQDSAGNWAVQQKIVASDRDTNEFFGYTVAISGNYLAVGTYNVQDKVLVPQPGRGSVYIFEKDSLGIWTEKLKITPSDSTNYEFGSRFDIFEGNLIIADPDPSDSTEAAYYLRDNGGNWILQQRISTSGWVDFAPISINGNRSMIGPYLFTLDSNSFWVENQVLVPSDSLTNNCFGHSVCLSDNNIFIGATCDKDQLFLADGLSGAGAVYMYEVPDTNMISPVFANAGTDKSLCIGTPEVLGGAPTGTGGTADSTLIYQWFPTWLLSDPGIANPTISGGTLTSDTVITYQVIVTDTITGVSDSDDVIVNLKYIPNVHLPDTTLLKGECVHWDLSWIQTDCPSCQIPIWSVIGFIPAFDVTICEDDVVLPPVGPNFPDTTFNILSIQNGICFFKDTVYIIFDSTSLPHNISGIVYKADSCFDQTKGTTKGVILKRSPGNFYTISNDSGFYSFPADSGTYTISQVTNNPNLLTTICPDSNFYVIQLDGTQDSSGNDFYNQVVECPYLTVDIASQRRRRCSSGSTVVNYCNNGFSDQSNVKIYVQFPEYVSFHSADSPYTMDSSGNYIFDIGSLASGACGKISIQDLVSCADSITGLSQCTKAWITPSNVTCLAMDSLWDKSDVTIKAICEAGNAVYFNVTNSGTGDMSVPSQVRIFANGLKVYSTYIQLNAGESVLFLTYNSSGQSLRMEANQTPGNPYKKVSHVDVLDCGNITYGFVEQLPQYDDSPEIEIHCLPIVDSYDPNDKLVFPSGVTSNHFVQPQTLLEYQIRFQNTGTDTAYKVVVVDTLSGDLDLSTIQWGVVSHDFELDISGNGNPVLTFTLNNINLVDSATNEAESSGFIKFKIAPRSDIAKGTIIHNKANIYFDFNAPITTNDVWVTISDTIPTGAEITVTNVTGIQEFAFINVKAVPNPFEDVFTIRLPDHLIGSNRRVKITDVLGREMDLTGKTRYTDQEIIVNGSGWMNGVYLLEISDNTSNRVIGRTKMIKK